MPSDTPSTPSPHTVTHTCTHMHVCPFFLSNKCPYQPVSPLSLWEGRWDGGKRPFIRQKFPYKVTLMQILSHLHLFSFQHLCHSCEIPPEWRAGHKLPAIWTWCKNHFVKGLQWVSKHNYLLCCSLIIILITQILFVFTALHWN